MSDPVEYLSAKLSPVVLDIDDGFRELGSRLPATSRPRRRGRRALILGIVAAGLIGAGGAAIATGGAHTGIFGSPGFTENDTSEYLDVTAPDFREVALGYAKGVDFAPRYSADMYIGILSPQRQQAQLPAGWPTDGGMQMQVTGVKGDIANWAFCSWAHTSTHDPVALEHMRAIANTPAMARTNQKRYNLALVEKAARGDSGPLDKYLGMNCPNPTPWPGS
jgi:hypothetical protein